MNSKETGKLSPLVILAISGSIFAMHFGASCMLWPTTWGRNSGTSFILAFSGFFFTGILLPFLAYFAVNKGGGPLFVVAKRVDLTFARIFGSFTVLIMGPLFVIPRMSAAAWDAITKVINIDSPPWIFLFIFTAMYYLITYWFIYQQSKIVDKVSKILVPLLLIAEIVIIGSIIISPIGEPVAKNYSQSPFAYGFIHGYQTMDLPAALMFAGVILTDIGVRIKNNQKAVVKNLIKTGTIGFIILGCIEFGEFWMGHTVSGVYADLNYAKLFASVVLHQFGIVGGAIFNIALIFAAMTTAIGLTAGTAEFFQKVSNEKISYRKAAIATLFLSTLVSVTGLETIVAWTAPILNLIYPPCIVLVLFTVFLTDKIGAMRGACYFSLFWGVIEAINGYLGLLGAPDSLSVIYNIVPGANAGFGFVIFMIFGAFIGQFLFKNTKPSTIKG